MPVVAIIAAIAVALGGLGGTAALAENSVPGDALYSVKTEVNEAVLSALSLTNKAKANFEVRKAEKRLEEAEDLILRGDNEALTKIEEKFNTHVKRIEELKDRLEEKGNVMDAVDINSRLESSIATHEKVLDRLRLKLDGEVEDNLTEKIEELQKKARELRQDGVKLEGALNAANVQKAAEGKLKAVQNQLKAVEKYFENKKDELSTESVTLVQIKIGEAKQKIEDAKKLIEKESYREAFRAYQEVTRLLQEIKGLMVTERRLELKTRVEERLKEIMKERDERRGEQEGDEEENDEDEDEEDDDSSASLEFDSGSVQFQAAI